MAFARGACNFFRCCFALCDDDDDTEQIVDDRAPPVDGSAMPSTGIVCDDNPYRFEMDAIVQVFNKKLAALKDEHEKRLVEVAEAHQRELAAFRNEHEEHLTILSEAHQREIDELNQRCDQFDSRINSLNEQQRYEEPIFPRIFPTYSDTYVREDQEVMPQFGP